MRLSRLRITWSIIVSLVVLSSVPCRSQEKVKFPIAASSKTLGYGPLWVAWKHGFFDQQGLDAQVIRLRGTPPSVQALVAGSVYVGGATPDAVMDVSERGIDLVMVVGLINGLSHAIMGGKNYKRYEDLRGATFGASSLSGGIITALKEALRIKGLEYPRDYKLLIVAGGSSPNCNPNYTPCVPNSKDDLNCPDVGHPVKVVGSDPYNLDSDGDGFGCESY